MNSSVRNRDSFSYVVAPGARFELARTFVRQLSGPARSGAFHQHSRAMLPYRVRRSGLAFNCNLILLFLFICISKSLPHGADRGRPQGSYMPRNILTRYPMMNDIAATPMLVTSISNAVFLNGRPFTTDRNDVNASITDTVMSSVTASDA